MTSKYQTEMDLGYYWVKWVGYKDNVSPEIVEIIEYESGNNIYREIYRIGDDEPIPENELKDFKMVLYEKG